MLSGENDTIPWETRTSEECYLRARKSTLSHERSFALAGAVELDRTELLGVADSSAFNVGAPLRRWIAESEHEAANEDATE